MEKMKRTYKCYMTVLLFGIFIAALLLCPSQVQAKGWSGIMFGCYYWKDEVELLQTPLCGFNDDQLTQAWEWKQDPIVFSYKGKTYTLSQKMVEMTDPDDYPDYEKTKIFYVWDDGEYDRSNPTSFSWPGAENLFTDKDTITLLSAPAIEGYEPMFLNREFTLHNYGGDDAFRFFFPIIYKKVGEKVDIMKLYRRDWYGFGNGQGWWLDLDKSSSTNGYYPYTGKAVTPQVKGFHYGLYKMKEGEDYSASYINNVNPGIKDNNYTSIGPIPDPGSSRPAVVIKGKGTFTGTAYYGFSISKQSSVSSGSQTGSTKANTLKKGTSFSAGGLKYKVDKVSGLKGTVQVKGITSKKAASANIPATVKKNGYILTVTSIGKSAFSSCQLKKIIIGKNVTSIGAKAFYNNKKLKTIIIKSKKLTDKKVGKKAFSKTAPKAKVFIPKSVFKKYKKFLAKKGFGKKVAYKRQ